jgi:pilus assembly protein CpaB
VSRRRRSVLLLGLALVLGGLAASDVAQREAALNRRLGPLVPVVVTRGDIAAGAALSPGRLAVRAVPARFVAPDTYRAESALAGLHAAAPLPAGTYLSQAVVRDPLADSAAGAPVRPGERVAEVVARASPELVVAGSRVDVLVTREGQGGGSGRTDLALQDVEVLRAGPAPADSGGGGQDAGDGGPRVSVSLRVTLRQAVFLTAAQSFAREIRLLPRAAGDRGHAGAGLSEGQGLR